MKINEKTIERLRDSVKIKELLSNGLNLSIDTIYRYIAANTDNGALTTKKSLTIISEYFNIPENEIITE